MRDFRKYDFWIDGMELVSDFYTFTKEFPNEERFGLSMQIQRAAVSIPSNIAEGASRESEKDFGRFLSISLGSAYELETQIRIAAKCNYLKDILYSEILDKIVSLQKKNKRITSKSNN